MDAWDRFLEKSIADDKQGKKESREYEIWILEHSDSLPDGIFSEALDCEREYREILDADIEHYKDWLVERKELDNED